MAARLEIKTEGGALDLLKDAENTFFVTRQIYDLHNFQRRNSDFTKFISVPATPRNVQLLEVAADVGTTTNATDKIQCSIIMGGVTLAPVAWLLVSGYNQDKSRNVTIDCQILYGNFNFFDSIKSATLDALNWADLTFFWSALNCADRAKNTYLENDVCIPLADWYDRSSKPPQLDIWWNLLDIQNMGFFLFARNILERMTLQSGYSLIIDDSVPDDFNKIALCCPVYNFIDPVFYEGTNPVTTAWSNSIDQSVTDPTPQRAIFDVSSGDPTGAYDPVLNQYDISVTQTYLVSVDGTYSHIQDGSANAGRVVLYQNGIEIDSLTAQDNQTDIPFRLSVELNAIAGDVFYCELESDTAPGGKVSTIILNNQSSFDLITPGVDTDYNIFVADHVPQIGQADFLGQIAKLFNLFVTTDDITKEVTFSSFNSIYTDEAVDLSDKLSDSSEYRTLTYLDSLAKDSRFEWIEDDLLRRDTSANLTFENSLLAREKIIIEMGFSACDESIYYYNSSREQYRKAKLPLTNIEREIPTGTGSAAPLADVVINTATGAFVLSDDISFELGDFFFVTGINPAIYRIDEKTDDKNGKFNLPVNLGGGAVAWHYKPSANTFDNRLAIIKIDGSEDQYFYTPGTTDLREPLPAGSQTATWGSELTFNSITADQYGPILGALKDTVVISAYFNLTAAEVLNFDLRRPVYVSQFNAFFYLNKIEQFKLDNLTRLELIRINEIV